MFRVIFEVGCRRISRWLDFIRSRFRNGGPCSGFGINCGAGCFLTVKVNTNGATTPGVPAPWMVYGDAWGSTPDSVVCSTGDPCAADACYAALGTDPTGLDIDPGTGPVELVTFSVE